MHWIAMRMCTCHSSPNRLLFRELRHQLLNPHCCLRIASTPCNNIPTVLHTQPLQTAHPAHPLAFTRRPVLLRTVR